MYSDSDLWIAPATQSVSVTVLMPNGAVIAADVERHTTLKELKEDVFETATRQPLHGFLRQDRSAYIFVCINEVTAEPEEVTDESRFVFEIKPFYAILRLIEKSGDEAEKTRNAQIGVLIGKGMHEFDAMKNSEVNDFRYRMSLVSEEMCQQRAQGDWRQRLRYLYPERLNRRRPLPSFIQKKITQSTLLIEISSMKGKMSQRFTLGATQTVREAVSFALGVMDVRNTQDPEDFLLKVVGLEEFLTGDQLLLDSVYVQECLGNNVVPAFIVVPLAVWIEKHMTEAAGVCIRKRTDSMVPRRGSALTSAETVTRKFSISIKQVTALNVADGAIVFMKVGLFHGLDTLSPVLSTDDKVYTTDEVTFNQPLVFATIVKNLTLVSRLCLALFERKNNKPIPLAWVNLTVYDYNHRLRRGSMTIPMWTHASDMEQESDLNVLGSNYPSDASEDAPLLTLSFARVTENDDIISYTGLEAVELPGFRDTSCSRSSHTSGSKHHMSQLRQICDKVPVNEIMEQDKELFRLLRADCAASLPHAIPHVLVSVHWHERSDVLLMNEFLRKWPLVEAERALCLLGPRFPSLEVRRYAIRCLQQLPDDSLQLYLLQLVQSLRSEVFLLSDLAQFLLRKALTNQVIGHYLFWLLRSEMQDPGVVVCFGLLLEAYCRGAPDHMPVLTRQVDSLKKLSILTDFMRLESVKKRESREKQKEYFQQTMSQAYYKDSLKNFRNTLNPRVHLAFLKVSSSDCMTCDALASFLPQTIDRKVQDNGLQDEADLAGLLAPGHWS